MATLRTTHNFNSQDYGKVAVIKALRSIGGIGLKEAKDGVELAAEGIPFEFTTTTILRDRYDEMEVFKEHGFILAELDSKTSIVLESVKQSVVFATKEGDNELARLLLNVLMDYDQILKDRDVERAEEAEARKIRDQAEKARQAEREKFQHEREMQHGAQQAQDDLQRLNKREQEQRIRLARDKEE